MRRRERRNILNPLIVEVGEGTYGATGIEVLEWQHGSVVRIGKYCSITENVTILLGENHAHDRISTYPFQRIMLGVVDGAKPDSYTNGDVTIGHDVWIGMGVTIMSGVSIGHGSIIAAYSHVTKDVPPYHIVGGNPAKVIRKRFTDEEIGQLLALRWWDHHDVRSIAPMLIKRTVPELAAALSKSKPKKLRPKMTKRQRRMRRRRRKTET
jgi:carbonic anhydrase/acetyltransferase-like protein (isoleucine patch superfamily)